MKWLLLKRGSPEELVGYLPKIFLDSDPRPAREQAKERYAHGGGWHPQEGWVLHPHGVAVYPGDPPLEPLAMTTLNDETLLVYPYGYVAVVQPDMSFEMSRMD
jgi:hypothetical protein